MSDHEGTSTMIHPGTRVTYKGRNYYVVAINESVRIFCLEDCSTKDVPSDQLVVICSES